MAPNYDLFLSYNSDDHHLVARLANGLEAAGLLCFFDRSYLKVGGNWVTELEAALDACRAVAVFIGPRGLGRWQQRERAWALDRQATDSEFPVIPVLLPGSDPPLGFLRQLTWVDLRDDPDEAVQIERLKVLFRGQHVEPRRPSDHCPYRGLMNFREEDAEFFFGREKYTRTLVEKLSLRQLLAVVGASGSGKSSVIQAGLVNHLRMRKTDDVWEVVTMYPRRDPFRSLAEALLPLVEPNQSGYELIQIGRKVAEDLKDGRTDLASLAAGIVRQQEGTDRVLLVVDQLEELYTECKEDDRQRFILELLDATQNGRSRMSVVLAVRSDFYSEVLKDRPLLDRLEESKIDLGPMNRDELREAIENPARVVEMSLQDGLVDRLLDDARNEPGRLPLLEFTLKELWERASGYQLTHDAYDRLGRITGAIATRAEVVFDALDRGERAAAPGVFRQLVRAGSKPEEDTRRRAAIHSLDKPSQRVVRKLAGERLLVTTHNPEGLDGQIVEASVPESIVFDGGETVELAHEELLRGWHRLRRWVDEDRQFLQWRARLGPMLLEYKRDAESTLLRKASLREALQFFSSRSKELDREEREFVIASINAEMVRRTKLTVVAISTIVIAAGAIFGVNSYLQHHIKRETVAAAVKALPTVSTIDVGGVLKTLQQSPEHARGVLQHAFDAEKGAQAKLRFAYGLIAVTETTDAANRVTDYVVNSIPEARTDESVHVVNALSKATPQQAVVGRLLRAANAEHDSNAHTRFLATALSLGATDHAAEVMALTNSPDGRSEFITHSFDWPGDLRRLAEVVRGHDGPDLRSGVFAALGRVAIENHSKAEQRAIISLLQSAYVEAPDPGTHNAAWRTLTEWEVEIPSIPPESRKETTDRDCYKNSVEMTMLKIKAGSFIMGTLDANAESPPHEITISSDFWIGDREVTSEQYQLVTRGRTKSAHSLHPVSDVTWFDAIEFCLKLSKLEGLPPYYQITDITRSSVDLGNFSARSEVPELVKEAQGSIEQAKVIVVGGCGYRLPAEAEWEYACRSGSQRRYCFGDSEELLPMFAVFRSSTKSLPCGSKLPNGWGLFDMHGNVFEWCQDWYDETYYEFSPLADPHGAESGLERVRRGGSWGFPADGCRAGYRAKSAPINASIDLGFRVARNICPERGSLPLGQSAEMSIE